MTKLELMSKDLAKRLEGAENKEEVLQEGIKSFASDALNLFQYLRTKNVDEDAAHFIMEQQGVDYNPKSKKFS